ncbi:MAG: Hint domain-containing protein [Pseudomonadota bacterium]
MRKYEVAHLLPNGDLDIFSRLAPAHPAFEDSFASLARGTLIKTDRGTVAIEDILPGDRVKTVTEDFQTVEWRGGITLVPGAQNHDPAMGRLIRMSADALGIGRPMPDLLLGPSARLHHRSPTLERVTGHKAALVPASDMIDGVNIITVTPQTAVQVFQIGFAGHQRFAANGVEVDSQHPGARHMFGLRGDMLNLYMSLFPLKESLDDFGDLLHPRMSLQNLDFGNVA